MDSATFSNLLAEEVKGYKTLLETEGGDWIVKGFIDVHQNIYSMTNDTKVVSKILELILVPRLEAFAKRNGLAMEFPSAQNFYPDLTFKDGKGNLFAVDFKSSYYNNNRQVNGLTLGSYWGYFRNRNVKKNMDHPYGDYKCHLILGILYRQSPATNGEGSIYKIDELKMIKSVIDSFVFFVQPKWKVASDRPGSGNTRNIGAATDIDDLVNGRGTFASLGEDVFDAYWTGYFNKKDARTEGIGKPHYHNIETYRKYLSRQSNLLRKISNRQ